MSDHALRMQYSDDGGRNWTNWDEASIGAEGEYDTRAVFTRLGSFRNRVFRFIVTSPRRCDLLGASAALQPTNG